MGKPGGTFAELLANHGESAQRLEFRPLPSGSGPNPSGCRVPSASISGGQRASCPGAPLWKCQDQEGHERSALCRIRGDRGSAVNGLEAEDSTAAPCERKGTKETPEEQPHKTFEVRRAHCEYERLRSPLLLQQYVGRLHGPHDGKWVVEVCDNVDDVSGCGRGCLSGGSEDIVQSDMELSRKAPVQQRYTHRLRNLPVPCGKLRETEISASDRLWIVFIQVSATYIEATGLKIRRPQGRGGSSPPLGTNKIKEL